MKYLLVGLSFLMSTAALAQNVLNAKSPEELREQRANKLVINEAGDSISTEVEPLAYGFIEDKDIIWSKVVWETIDLKERLNQPYSKKGDEIIQNTKSLYEVLMDGMKSGRIKEVYATDDFTQRLDYDQIVSKLEFVEVDQAFLDDLAANGETPAEGEGVLKHQLHNDDVRMIQVKGLWYIDRRVGELKYRLLGLALLSKDIQAQTTQARMAGIESNEMFPLFWIWYPDARKELSNFTIFNPKNSTSSITYDEVLNARRFSSIIYKAQTNVGVKAINEYIPEDAKSQLEEHNRIRNSIIQQESDMWNY
ncbi:type IX secretion system ring subunit PorN/GldN [Faecalibacter bovis]|uniref:Gliding motility protein GldN n=1 Tax=Faecalibacter bovis TaxID=2898187 RepID=A0ABX7XE66_9FLAO|nr:gliding motility protein GldN [Faecalibacter bovis]MBS7332456.1 gliding motility protein GldN [Weeksellaceae bacterium]QTV06209.1 gliding motility protein GldN [Faecalibacter bovis]